MIGIISDTHDNKNAIEKIIKVLNDLDVELVLHAGDHIAPFTVKWLSRLNAKVIGVSGNNDCEKRLLRSLYEDNGWVFKDFIAEIEYRGRRIVVTHGTYQRLVDALIKSNLYDIVVYGHTHEIRVEKVGSTLVINPGEACGYLTGRKTLAIYDPIKDEVKIIDL